MSQCRRSNNLSLFAWKWGGPASFTGSMQWLWKRCLLGVAITSYDGGGPGTLWANSNVLISACVLKKPKHFGGFVFGAVLTSMLHTSKNACLMEKCFVGIMVRVLVVGFESIPVPDSIWRNCYCFVKLGQRVVLVEIWIVIFLYMLLQYDLHHFSGGENSKNKHHWLGDLLGFTAMHHSVVGS